MNPPAIPTSTSRCSQPPPPPLPLPLPRRSSNSIELSKTTVKVTNIESLPDELLFDILACLPAEFLHDISRLVCRKWRRIIHSEAFANRQIQHSAYGLLVSSEYLLNCHHTIYAAARQGRIETTDYSSDKGRGTIISCCNGLALELHHKYYVNGKTLIHSLHVMNPLTKKSFLLPSFPVKKEVRVNYGRSGIGYSTASMKYKVTLPYTYHVQGGDRLICLAILTVGVDKSWRHIEMPGLLGDLRQLLRRSPLTSEGFLHWGRRRGDCLTLNVEIEKFTARATPSINQSYYTYLSTGRYLSVLVGSRTKFCWDVWEMQCGGREWKKLEYKIDLEAQNEKIQQCANSYHITHLFPVGWVKYPEILVFRVAGSEWRNCIFYNLETHEIETTELHGDDDGECGGGSKAYNVHRINLVHLV